MAKINDTLEGFKEKFQHLLVHKKKLLALDNISQAVPFQHNDYLILIKRCLRDGFLGPEESSFLVYLVGKYFSDKNFLDWSHQTKWLKTEMRRLARENKKFNTVQMDIFNWSKMKEQHVRLTMPITTVTNTDVKRQVRVS